MQNSRLRVLAQCALLTALFILSAFIRIPIPYVPITLQTFAVMLSALCFGGKITAVSLGAYILMGLCGLPVFTQGGGLGYFLKPTFGYLAGMLPAATVCAFLSRRKNPRTYLGDFAACLGASLTIYLVGVPYLYIVSNYVLGLGSSFSAVLTTGFLSTLPGDLLKCAAAALAAPRLRKALDIK